MITKRALALLSPTRLTSPRRPSTTRTCFSAIASLWFGRVAEIQKESWPVPCSRSLSPFVKVGGSASGLMGLSNDRVNTTGPTSAAWRTKLSHAPGPTVTGSFTNHTTLSCRLVPTTVRSSSAPSVSAWLASTRPWQVPGAARRKRTTSAPGATTRWNQSPYRTRDATSRLPKQTSTRSPGMPLTSASRGSAALTGAANTPTAMAAVAAARMRGRLGRAIGGPPVDARGRHIDAADLAGS